jgi:large subunit ribosomal protein L24
MPIKTGQTVKVITGKDKGKTGKVTQVFPRDNRVVVEGVNKMYKHLKQRVSKNNRRSAGPQKGERVEYFGPIHISNVTLTEEKAAEPKKAKADKK